MISIDSQPAHSSVATPIVSTSTSKNTYGSLYAPPFSPWSMHRCVDKSEQATRYHAVCLRRPTANPPCSNISRFGMLGRCNPDLPRERPVLILISLNIGDAEDSLQRLWYAAYGYKLHQSFTESPHKCFALVWRTVLRLGDKVLVKVSGESWVATARNSRNLVVLFSMVVIRAPKAGHIQLISAIYRRPGSLMGSAPRSPRRALEHLLEMAR